MILQRINQAHPGTNIGTGAEKAFWSAHPQFVHCTAFLRKCVNEVGQLSDKALVIIVTQTKQYGKFVKNGRATNQC